jgi:acyl dehydratase
MAGDLTYEGIDTGAEYGPFKYPLADRIERYLEAVENQHPWHRERSPWGPPVAPPTVIAAASLRFIDTVAPVPPGTLHAKQELFTSAATRLDRTPIGYGQFVEKYERRGRRWFVFEIRWRDETGLILGRTRTTMAFPETVETADEEQPPKGERAEPTAWLTPVTRTLAQSHIDAYTEDSANALRGSSIHLHEDVAKAAGFKTTVAQGMMAADYASEVLEAELGKEWYSNASLSLAFLSTIYCGDTITTGAGLAGEEEDGAMVRRTYAVRAENQDGEVVAAGTATALVDGS